MEYYSVVDLENVYKEKILQKLNNSIPYDITQRPTIFGYGGVVVDPCDITSAVNHPNITCSYIGSITVTVGQMGNKDYLEELYVDVREEATGSLKYTFKYNPETDILTGGYVI